MIVKLFVSSIIFMIINYTKVSSEENLVLVHALFRHGQRTGLKESAYPNDPYKNLTYFPYGYGELTSEGKRNAYQLGKFLRERYNNFLGQLYTPEIVEARSTFSSRTKATLQLVLAGLFPPKGTSLEWNMELNWQPIPYQYKELQHDKLFFGNYACPNYQKFYTNYLESQQGQELINNYRDIIDYVSKNTGLDMGKDINKVLYIMDSLNSQSLWGLPLPTWAEKVYPGQYIDIVSRNFLLWSATKEMKQVTAGYLLKKMVDDTLSHINGSLITKGRKLYLYSGHDVNISELLIALDVFEPHIPPFTSCVLIEIYHVNDQYGVKIFYKKVDTGEIQLLKLPNCEEFCFLGKFISITEQYFPDEIVCGEI